MRVRLAVGAFAIALLPGAAYAEQGSTPGQSVSDQAAACTNESGTDVAFLEVERSGCCSWHDGVCGCYGDRAQCCDGSLSPSCECRSSPSPSDPARPHAAGSPLTANDVVTAATSARRELEESLRPFIVGD